MSRRKTIVISVLIGAFVIAGSLVVLAQVAGEDVGRDILRMRRQKDTGQTETTAEAPPVAVSATKTEAPAVAPVQATAPKPAAVADEVLSLVPADCLFCVRINKLDTSLGAVDQFITGVSPLPISMGMLAKGQLGKLLADPSLAGVNTQGDFVIFAAPLPPAAGAPAFMPQVGLGMLAPVSDKAFFQRYAGSELPGGKYALIGLEPQMAQSLAAVKQQVASGALAGSLAVDLASQSKASPVWAYVNIAGAVKLFGPILFAQLDQVTAIQSNQPGAEADAKMTAATIDFVKAYLVQLDSLTLTADPRPDTLSAALTVSALPNTDLAGLLVRDPAMKPGYSMAGMMNEPAAINVLAKVNRPMWARLNKSIMGLLAKALADKLPADTMAKWDALSAASMDVMGDELAVSLSFAPGMPPLDLKEIIKTKDAAATMDLIKQGLGMANEMYKAMGVEAAVSLDTAGTPYRQSQIYAMKLDMKLPPEASEQERQMMQQMMAGGFNYRLAVAGGYMLIAAGPEADADIRAMVDQTGAGVLPAAAGDIKTAMAIVPGAANTDFVASLNVPRLVSGVGGLLGAMPVPNGPAVAEALSSVNIPTQSCIGFAGMVANGRGTLQIVLPKQHVLEVLMMAGAMQQKMMQNMTQPATPPNTSF